MPIKIAMAGPADAEELRDLVKAHIPGYPDSDWPMFTALAEDRLADDGVFRERVLRAVDPETGRVIGVLAACPPWAAIQEAGLPQSMTDGILQVIVKLSAVVVVPEFRRQRVGRRLVLRAMAEFREVDYQQMYGSFEPTSPGLPEFYARLGFDVLPEGESMVLFSGALEWPTHGERWFTQSLAL